MTMINVTIATANADLIFEAAKRLKAAKSRLGNKGQKEQEARDALKALQVEANAVTTAMVNDEYMSGMRDLATIQKEMKAAHNKVDKAIEKAHADKEALAEAVAELESFLNEETVAEAA